MGLGGEACSQILVARLPMLTDEGPMGEASG